MEILFKEEILGKLENTYREEFWIHGNFIPSSHYLKYKDFLDAIVCEDGFDETQFDQALLDENNWFAKSENGQLGIEIPAIYSDGDISIRYR